jgi:hypothetical protein
MDDFQQAVDNLVKAVGEVRAICESKVTGLFPEQRQLCLTECNKAAHTLTSLCEYLEKRVQDLTPGGR